MPKQKTKKAVAKRFSKTAGGKIKRTSAGGAHILTGKSRKRKRRMNESKLVADGDFKRVSRCLHG